MVNQPSYNPNNRTHFSARALRNRAVTDLFEPGSTLKAFTIACAPRVGPVSPGHADRYFTGLASCGSNTVRDVHNYGAWM